MAKQPEVLSRFPRQLSGSKGRSFYYDAENKQKEARNSSNQTIGLYYFDGDGRMVKKVTAAETVIFVYDAGGKLVAEYSTSLSQTPQVQYLTNDHLGTPRINTNENGAVVSRTDYMPYGEEIIGLGGRSTTDKYVAADVRQGFTGYINDEETGLDFAHARMYKKELGRFTGSDPIFLELGRRGFPQGFNLYSYVRNNPISLTDPNGMDVRVNCKTNGKTKADKDKETSACESGTSTNLNNRKNGQFTVEVKDGRLSVVGKVDRSKLSEREKKLYDTITDTTPGVSSTLNVLATSDEVTFGRFDKPGENSIDLGDLAVLNNTGDKTLSGETIAHEILEGSISDTMLGNDDNATFREAHKEANKFFGNVSIEAESIPAGVSVISREVTYRFEILDVDVRVNKTFTVKQPGASITSATFPNIRGKVDQAELLPTKPQ